MSEAGCIGCGRLGDLQRQIIARALLALCMIGGVPSHAQEVEGDRIAISEEDASLAVGRVTGLPIPRFVSLKKPRANARVGPGPNYPVQWVYLRQGLPVEITAEHNNWRRIRDHDGDEAWVYHALIDGRRTAIIEDKQVTLWRKEGSGKNEVLAYLDPGVIVRLRKCGESQCRVEVGDAKGWIERSVLWGLYPDEVIN